MNTSLPPAQFVAPGQPVANGWRGLTIGCRGCGALHAFDRMKVLRAGPAPLTLVSLGRWASIAAVAGDPSRGCRAFLCFQPLPMQVHIGECIYCGNSDCELGDEHIIPFGLNGEWVLGDASCQTCAAVTSRIERHVLRHLLLIPRTTLGLKTRRPKQRPTSFLITFESEGEVSTVSVGREKYPPFIHLPNFDLPSCLTDLPPVTGIHIRGLDTIQFPGRSLGEFSRDQGVEKVSVKVKFSPVELARMLGKIAYGFAVAAFGLEAVRGSPLVRSFMQEPNTIGILVGSADEIPAHAPTLHQVELAPQDWGVLVQVRLFAQFGSRPYLVAVPGSPSTVSAELGS